jgi:hypothetical protein
MWGGGPKVRGETLKGATTNLRQGLMAALVERAVEEARQSEFFSETPRCVVPQDTSIVERGIGKWDKRDNIENPKTGVHANMLGEIKARDNSSSKLNDAFKQGVVRSNQSKDTPMMDGISVYVNATGCFPFELIDEHVILTL